MSGSIGWGAGLQSSRLVQGKGSNPLKVLIKENKVIYHSINQLNSGWCHTVIQFHLYIYIYILKGRLSNYKSHHKKKYISCGITEHFLEDSRDFGADFEFLPIVKLLNPPSTIVKRQERLEEFELYWQEYLVTYEPYWMNKKT